MSSSAASPWPDACLAAVSITFDDGMQSQLARAVPMLNNHNLQATFYLNPRENYQEQLRPWQAVAQAGHELGNHTVRHPCSMNFGFVADSGRTPLEKMTLADIEAEIVQAGDRLAEVVPQAAVSFAYPCYQPYVGRGATRQSYVPMVAKHCVAGRGRGERANDPRYCDLFYLWSQPCERMTGAELVGIVEHAIREGRWTILTFHGVHEGHLSIGDGDLAELCAHLDRNRARVWTAPVATVAQRVAHYQATYFDKAVG